MGMLRLEKAHPLMGLLIGMPMERKLGAYYGRDHTVLEQRLFSVFIF